MSSDRKRRIAGLRLVWHEALTMAVHTYATAGVAMHFGAVAVNPIHDASAALNPNCPGQRHWSQHLHREDTNGSYTSMKGVYTLPAFDYSQTASPAAHPSSNPYFFRHHCEGSSDFLSYTRFHLKH